MATGARADRRKRDWRFRRVLVMSVSALAMSSALAAWDAAPLGRASAAVTTQTTTGFGWPLKPFNRPHPIRANFGDPRMDFHGPPTTRTLYHPSGSFHFHRGIDIYGPRGAKVYPVRDGIVVLDTGSHIVIRSPDGTSFEYWHIGASLSPGTFVHAGKTVLGTIRRPLDHVDLTELTNGQAVNPLAPGHLTPYVDRTRPVVASIRLQSDNAGHVVFPNFVRGSVWLVAEAYDLPSLSVPGDWHRLPVAPALVTWRIQRVNAKVVVPTRVAVDFRTNLPSQGAFWKAYARGTFQNMGLFGKHYSYLQPGSYLFLLSAAAFDTRPLPDGVYNLVVTATDIRGNSGTRSLRFTIHNKPGWVG